MHHPHYYRVLILATVTPIPNPHTLPNQNGKRAIHTHLTPRHCLRRTDSLPLHRLNKRLQRQRGRIKRHLMPSAKHPHPAQIPLRLERPSRGAIDRV